DVGRGVARRGRADVFQDVEQYRVIERRRTDWLRPVGERDQADGIRPVFGRAAVEVRPVRPVPPRDEGLERPLGGLAAGNGRRAGLPDKRRLLHRPRGVEAEDDRDPLRGDASLEVRRARLRKGKDRSRQGEEAQTLTAPPGDSRSRDVFEESEGGIPERAATRPAPPQPEQWL